jgi:hypothetical protein
LGLKATIGGGEAAQIFPALSGHLVWKPQPLGGWARDGGGPVKRTGL